MKKKIISNILVVTLLNVCGCYSTEIAKPEEYMRYQYESGKPEAIYVITKDMIKYHFNSWEYLIDKDTLFGVGTLIIYDHSDTIDVKVALSEIESIQWEKSNMVGNILVIAGAALIIFTVFALVAVGKSYDEI